MAWYWILTLMFLLAWLMQNCIHELSHLVVGWRVCGDKPTGFYPYPHFYEGKFYFARYEAWLGEKDHYLKHIAPFYAAVIWVWFVGINYLIFNHVGLYVLPFAVCGSVDAVWWVLGALSKNPENDYNRWKRLKFTH